MAATRKTTVANSMQGKTPENGLFVQAQEFNEAAAIIDNLTGNGTAQAVSATTLAVSSTAAVTGAATFASTVGVTGLLTASAGIKVSATVTQYTADVALTSANLLAMYATPVTVVAAPSSAYALDFVGAVLINDDATDYAGGGAITIRIGDTELVSASLASTFLTTNGDRVWNLQKLNAAGGYSMLVGTALKISNAAGAFTTGTGVCRLKITYNVIETGL